MNLYPLDFFDLSDYQHSSLFSLKEYVWKALTLLPKYLQSIPLGEINGEVSDKAFLIDSHLITLGKGSVVEPGAYIKGPCYIGENCIVRHGAYIRGFLLTGNRCVIGHDTEIKNAIFLDDVHAAHFAYLGDSILGNGVNLGAGVKCANLKLDHQQIVLAQGIATGERKLGAIIGDRTQLGCNVVTNPGTLIGKDVFCYPTLNIGGVIDSQVIVKGNTKIEITKKIKK